MTWAYKCKDCESPLLALDEPYDYGSTTLVCLKHSPPLVWYHSGGWVASGKWEQRPLTPQEMKWLDHYLTKFKELGELLKPLVTFEVNADW